MSSPRHAVRVGWAIEDAVKGGKVCTSYRAGTCRDPSCTLSHGQELADAGLGGSLTPHFRERVRAYAWSALERNPDVDEGLDTAAQGLVMGDAWQQHVYDSVRAAMPTVERPMEDSNAAFKEVFETLRAKSANGEGRWQVMSDLVMRYGTAEMIDVLLNADLSLSTRREESLYGMYQPAISPLYLATVEFVGIPYEGRADEVVRVFLNHGVCAVTGLEAQEGPYRQRYLEKTISMLKDSSVLLDLCRSVRDGAVRRGKESQLCICRGALLQTLFADHISESHSEAVEDCVPIVMDLEEHHVEESAECFRSIVESWFDSSQFPIDSRLSMSSRGAADVLPQNKNIRRILDQHVFPRLSMSFLVMTGRSGPLIVTREGVQAMTSISAVAQPQTHPARDLVLCARFRDRNPECPFSCLPWELVLRILGQDIVLKAFVVDTDLFVCEREFVCEELEEDRVSMRTALRPPLLGWSVEQAALKFHTHFGGLHDLKELHAEEFDDGDGMAYDVYFSSVRRTLIPGRTYVVQGYEYYGNDYTALVEWDPLYPGLRALKYLRNGLRPSSAE